MFENKKILLQKCAKSKGENVQNLSAIYDVFLEDIESCKEDLKKFDANEEISINDDFLGKRKKNFTEESFQFALNEVKNLFSSNDIQIFGMFNLDILAKEIFNRNWADVCDFSVYSNFRDRGYILHKGNMFGFNYLVYDKTKSADRFGIEHSFAAIEFLTSNKKTKGIIQSSRICENYGKSTILLTFSYKDIEKPCEINSLFCKNFENQSNLEDNAIEP